MVLLAALVVPGNAAAAPTCFGKTATIVGTAGDDDLYKGGGGTDVWVGLAGDDFMDWEDWSGRDFMCGNSGNDTFNPATESDKVDGGGGGDLIRGGGGSDKLFGGRGNDTIYNASVSPGLTDGVPDLLDGGPGTDTCVVEYNEDTGAVDTYRNCEHVIEVAQ